MKLDILQLVIKHPAKQLAPAASVNYWRDLLNHFDYHRNELGEAYYHTADKRPIQRSLTDIDSALVKVREIISILEA